MIVKKIDKRFAGYLDFKYYINLAQSGEINFHNVRAWCWNTWGPSKNYVDWDYHNRHPTPNDVCQNSNWCWQDDDHRTRIMFKEKEDVALFKLYYGA
jgi:hypothetical protein